MNMHYKLEKLQLTGRAQLNSREANLFCFSILDKICFFICYLLEAKNWTKVIMKTDSFLLFHRYVLLRCQQCILKSNITGGTIVNYDPLCLKDM